MKFKIQLVCEEAPTKKTTVETLLNIEKNSSEIESIGLSLKEAKNTLEELQKRMVSKQIDEYLEEWKLCNYPVKLPRKKGSYTIKFKTLFGNINIKSPRYYHVQRDKKRKTFSPLKEIFRELVSPERQYLETKWASKISFQQASELISDVLPVDHKINACSIRNHLSKTSSRIQEELDEEKYFFQDELNDTNDNYSTFTVGIDGGYVRNWNNKKKHFEVIAGKSIPNNGDNLFFGFVDTLPNSKSKRNVFKTLEDQGLNRISQIEFFSDGAENLRDIQFHICPNSKYYIDWFHITMKMTVLEKYIQGISKLDKNQGKELEQYLTKIKWYLWHGNKYKYLTYLEFFIDSVDLLEIDYPHLKNFKKLATEFVTYIHRNSNFITNYGERYRNNETISTSFVESTVNVLVSKRFSKKQQMQWTKEGAHSMLQVRSKMLNDRLKDEFQKWYPKIELEYSKAA